MANNKDRLPRFLFILSLASMLGTPPTIGFFAKILTFYVLIQNSGFWLFVSTFLTLTLIIFYLQAIRAGNTLRKKHQFRFSRTHTASTALLIYLQIFFLITLISAPYVFDIMYGFFM